MKNNFFKFMLFVAVALVALVGCKEDDPDDPDDPTTTTYEDGIYIDGTALDLSTGDLKSLLKKGRIEGEGYASLEREGLWEGFYYFQAGDFTVFEVSGTTQTHYGADAIETVSLDGVGDNILGDVVMGTFKADGTAFSIATAGLYHVIFDVETSKIAYAKVNEMAIIGAATPSGWDAGQVMTEVSLSTESGSWKIENLVLRSGSFKFRYNDGWKIDLTDFVVFTNIGGDESGTAIMGGGGWDNPAEEQGIYTVEFNWSISDGFTYTKTKTGELPGTEWTGVVLDAVGDGISADNTNAIPDPSGWGWGNKLLADNDGVPTMSGTVYTWTWTNVVLVADAGFKVRTEDGVAPANGNGGNFDVGLDAIDRENSTSNIIEGESGDIKVTVDGTYNFTFTIDAGNLDTKTLIITEAK